MKIGYLMQEGVVNLWEVPPSGPSVHVRRVIEELKALGHQLVLVARSDGQVYLSTDFVTFKAVDQGFLNHGFFRIIEKVVRRVQSSLRLPYLNLFNSLKFAFACRKQLSDCDVLYERFGWIGYGGWIASRFLKIPIIWELNGDHVEELASHGFALRGAQKWVSFQLMRMIATRVDYTIATGNGWRKKHILRWGVAPERVSVIENGSQIVDMLSRPELKSFQNSSSIDEVIRVVYLGAFEPWHGIKILLKAFSSAVPFYPDLHLDLIGDGPEREELFDLVQALKLDACVNLTGQLDFAHALPYLRNADIAVSPYCGRAEFSGLKLLDYKAAGLAIIASGQDGQPDVLAHGHTGWIVPPCDENALSEAIVSLAGDPALRRQIGREARLEAEQYHRWANTAQKLELLFQEVLAGQPHLRPHNAINL